MAVCFRVSALRLTLAVPPLRAGTGSVGAALGPVLAGYASAGDDWTNVFIILMVADAVAILVSRLPSLCSVPLGPDITVLMPVSHTRPRTMTVRSIRFSA